MTFDHIGKLLVGHTPLPFEAGAPVLEELPRSCIGVMIPHLPEALLEQTGSIAPIARGQQLLGCPLPGKGKGLRARQQRVFLPLNVATIHSDQPAVLALTDLIERIIQVGHDVELVKQKGRLRGVVGSGIAEHLLHA